MFKRDFTGPALLVPDLVPQSRFGVRGCHPLWPDFPDRSVNIFAKNWWLFPVRSPLLGKSQLMSFPPGTKMFQFPGCASITYEFSHGYQINLMGCPIRKSPDQSLLNNSPRLIAASCVLHRSLMSRHSPYALVLPLLNLND